MATVDIKRSLYFSPVELQVLMHTYGEYEQSMNIRGKESSTNAATKVKELDMDTNG